MALGPDGDEPFCACIRIIADKHTQVHNVVILVKNVWFLKNVDLFVESSERFYNTGIFTYHVVKEAVLLSIKNCSTTQFTLRGLVSLLSI